VALVPLDEGLAALEGADLDLGGDRPSITASSAKVRRRESMSRSSQLQP
jgi:hypothetical protein